MEETSETVTVQAAILLANEERLENATPVVTRTHLETILDQQSRFLEYQKKLYGMSPEQKAFQDLNRYEFDVDRA